MATAIAGAAAPAVTSGQDVDRSRTEIIRQLGIFDIPDLIRLPSREYFVIGADQDIGQEFPYPLEKVEVMYRKFREDGSDETSGEHPWVPSFFAKLGVYVGDAEHPSPAPQISEDGCSFIGTLKPLASPEMPYQAKVIAYTKHSAFYAEKIAELKAMLERLSA